MKKAILFFVYLLTLQAQTIKIDHFSTNIFSSISKELKRVELSLIVEGRYIEDEKYKVIDATNVIIGSFYVESLATSKGKENFKKLLKEYSAKKYGVDIDEVYILNFQVVENRASFSIDDLIKRLKDEGCCKRLAPLVKARK